MKLYVKRFSERRTIMIDGFEKPVLIPDMPHKREMVNFGVALQQQKFNRTEIPEDIRDWEKKREEQFIADEWHKRLNGVWILIKGEPVYLTGPAYVFFNYWVTERGELPTFRMEAVEYFQIWDMALRDKTCLGLFDIKARRLGDTEKASFCGWELITRYRNSWFGMQNTNDENAKENFQRIIMSNRSMVYFFKPVPVDSDTPQNIMEFRFPKQRVAKTRESMRAQNEEARYELRSRIDFKATKLREYDGKRLRYYHLDEPGKIEPAIMNIKSQWDIVKICLTTNNMEIIVGKAALTTTVEHFKDGEAVELLKDMWDMSDPNVLNENGRTASGLWRVFRGYKLTAQVDEWGYHKVDEVTKTRANEIRHLQEKKRFDDVTSYKRKFPATIEEALVPPEDDCILSPYLIDEQKAEIERKLLSGVHWDNRAVEGELVWKAGFGSEVMWVPTSHGKWLISSHPARRNAKENRGGTWKPLNTEYFGAGVDPIDHMAPKSNASQGAIAVGAIFNPMLEDQSLLQYDENGNITNPELMKTNRCACTYVYRHENPYDFYEDVLKTLLYFGCKANIETQKPGLIPWLLEKGYSGFYANRPMLTDSKGLVRKNRHGSSNIGTPANTETIMSYVEAIKTHNISYVKTHTHMPLLIDMRLFNGKKENRTKRDLTVAWGLALTLCNSTAYIQERTKKPTNNRAMPFRNFNRQYNHN